MSRAAKIGQGCYSDLVLEGCCTNTIRHALEYGHPGPPYGILPYRALDTVVFAQVPVHIDTEWPCFKHLSVRHQVCPDPGKAAACCSAFKGILTVSQMALPPD